MKLTAKLVSAFMLVIIILTAVNGYFAVRREVQSFEQEASADAQRLGTVLEEMVSVVWRETGQEKALQLIRKAGTEEHHVQIRWVWFDARPGSPHSPATPPDRLEMITIERKVSIIKARHPDGKDYLHTYWPIPVAEERKGGLEFAKSMSQLEQKKRNVILRTLLLMGAMVLVTGFVTALTGIRVVGQPLRRLIDKARRVGAGDLSGPVHLRSRDELGELAESLNQMCDQLSQSQEKTRQETAARTAAMDQLRHADRLKTVGRLAAGMAHELGTPLNVVSGRAGLITSGKLSKEEIVASANAIKAEAGQMTRIIRQLLDFARRGSPQRALVDLLPVARQAVDMLSSLAQKQNVALSLADGDKPFVAMVDVGQIQQALTNLIVNAIQAMPDGGKVEVGIGREHARPPEGHKTAAGEYVCVHVQDEGEGIAEDDMEHLFEPFFTTKDVGEGTGLGLSVAYGIVEEHGGWIEVTSEAGKGSCFSIYLPEESDQ